ncbi:MAG: sel1 repeat family protein [Gammaproteobacteria bacterium]|nr:sel1 repeat family protein [Gammaproteobacteria bacterium]
MKKISTPLPVDLEALKDRARSGNMDALHSLVGHLLLAVARGDVAFRMEAVRWVEYAEGQDIDARMQLLLAMIYATGSQEASVDEPTEFLRTMPVSFQDGSEDLSLTGEQLGIVCDYGKTIHWLQRAAEQGDKEAQIFLAMSYESGGGVARDGHEAARWYAAASSGDAAEQYRLGDYYAKGKGGLAPNEQMALEWYRKAADSGYAGAQSRCEQMALKIKSELSETAIPEQRVALAQSSAFFGTSVARKGVAGDSAELPRNLSEAGPSRGSHP